MIVDYVVLIQLYFFLFVRSAVLTSWKSGKQCRSEHRRPIRTHDVCQLTAMPIASFTFSPTRTISSFCWTEIVSQHFMLGKQANAFIMQLTISTFSTHEIRILPHVFSYLMDLVTKCGINLKMGIVQTAYANGASTDYIRNELVNLHRVWRISICIEFKHLFLLFGSIHRKCLLHAYRLVWSICITRLLNTILACTLRQTVMGRLCSAIMPEMRFTQFPRIQSKQ